MNTAAAPYVWGWLRTPRSDLAFTIGGVVFSLAFLGLHLGLGIGGVVLWWVWILALDGPHIFATLARTYLDPQEWQNRAPLLVVSLGWFLLGPATVGLSLVLATALPYHIFLAFASLWAYWHVVRQHYGVMVLYKKKNQDMDPVDDRIDALMVYGGQIGPLVAFALTHPQARATLGLGADPITTQPIVMAAWLSTAAVVLLFGARQVVRWRRGLPLNGPKLLLLSAVVGLAALLFSPWIVARADYLAFFVVVTVFHNIQYHAIVWGYMERRYRSPGAWGWAGKVATHGAVYAGLGLLFTLIYRGLGCSLGAHPGCGAWGPQITWGSLNFQALAVAFMWGFALHHYYLDQKIWRLKKDPQLNRDLRVGA